LYTTNYIPLLSILSWSQMCLISFQNRLSVHFHFAISPLHFLSPCCHNAIPFPIFHHLTFPFSYFLLVNFHRLGKPHDYPLYLASDFPLGGQGDE
jgi:hypothetical protein